MKRYEPRLQWVEGKMTPFGACDPEWKARMCEDPSGRWTTVEYAESLEQKIAELQEQLSDLEQGEMDEAESDF